MKKYNLFFSPTGGTKKVTLPLMKGFGEDFTEIDLITYKDYDKLQFEEDDLCIVAVPSFGGRVPAPAVETLYHLKGNGAKAVLVVVYGNRAIDDTLVELADVLDNSDFTCVAGMEAVAQHSLIPSFGAGRPDADDNKQLEAFAKEIIETLKTENYSKSLSFPGSRPYVEFGGVPIKPKTTGKCIQCGLCALECPAHAIPKKNPKLTNKEKCISCMHCVAICPEHARKISSIMVSAAEAKMKKACSGRKPNKLYI